MSTEERTPTLQQPILKGGCAGLRINFAEEVKMKQQLQWCQEPGTGHVLVQQRGKSDTGKQLSDGAFPLRF